MNQRRPLGLLTLPVLAFTASCLLDTTPLTADREKADAQPAEVLPTQDTQSSEELDAAVTAPVEDASAQASVAVVTAPPPPNATHPMMDAGAPPPMAASATDAGSVKAPMTQQCNGLSSYGLQATIEVTWASTQWFDAGSGSIELYGLVQVDTVDAHTHEAAASFQVCGLDLPSLNSRALCSSYQLQFPHIDKLAKHALSGTYSCDAAQCSLQFSPLSYTTGIQLTDANGPWPALKDTTPAQFPDDDADGFPGVSVDVVSIASVSSGPTGCSAPGGSTDSRGQGPNGKNKKTNTPAVMPASIGRLLLGLRTQLSAAMKLTPECQLRETTGSAATLDLRSAGCFVSASSDPASAAMGCSEELRSSFDQTLPRYKAVESSSGPGAKKTTSTGTLLKAVRFAPGAKVSCEQVRSSMF